MTESEWLTGTDPTPMLELLQSKASARKLRLFAVECVRRNWQVLTKSSRTLVDVTEANADGLIPNETYVIAVRKYERVIRSVICTRQTEQARLAIRSVLHLFWQADSNAVQVAQWTAHESGRAAMANQLCGSSDNTESPFQSSLLRCIFGNPFHHVTIGPTWLSSSVVALSEAIYAERAFDRLPILADALEEAGCDNADILNHCRGGGPHVRGCWVVDLILGKQ